MSSAALAFEHFNLTIQSGAAIVLLGMTTAKC